MAWVRWGAFMMAAAVVMGAFGAHALKARLSDSSMDIYKTAVLYHLIHGLAIFAVAWLGSVTADSKIHLAGTFFLLGILLFSGSLYILAVSGIRWFGAITPLGGLCFIIGWFLIAIFKPGR